MFHPILYDDVFEVLVPILLMVGWVCQDCIGTITEKRKVIDNEIKSLGAAVRKLEEGHQTLLQMVESGAAPKTAGADQSVSSTNISQVVFDTVKDQLRRSKSVIISGLPESSDVSLMLMFYVHYVKVT